MKHNFGSWKSPITSDMVVSRTISISSPVLYKKQLYWIESRPNEGGRNVLVKMVGPHSVKDVTPHPFNIRN